MPRPIQAYPRTPPTFAALKRLIDLLTQADAWAI
jgi:hypothetical protein